MTDNQTELEALRDRVAQLEDQQEQLAQGATDAQGRSWTVSDFLSLGLTRRQAVTALGLIAGGMALPTALTQSAVAAPGDDGDTVLGSSSNRWDAWMDELDANAVSTEKIDSSPGYSWSAEDRSFDTVYNAPSDKDIYFVVSAEAEADNTLVNLGVYIDGSFRVSPSESVDSGDRVLTPVYRIPAGVSYELRAFGDSGSYTINNWNELR
ncbi:hypothetical protein [Haloplanus halophilus]|uniref:hypothetical protein n=1 Tax=Haloplanus halophilus TaxID=2949993 RepID=UPI00203B44ED|nr:hypothetical protein [Haloplanus sp. GDY1]